VGFVRRWSEKTEISAGWLDTTADWRERYGKVNEHNGWVPRDFPAGGLEEAGHAPCVHSEAAAGEREPHAIHPTKLKLN